MKQFFWLNLVIVFIGCSSKSDEKFNPDVKKEIIKANGLKWSEGLRKADTSIIQSIYDENAHYVPDGFTALHGNAAIVRYWKESFPILKDVRLNMESLEGTKELLYETGNGYSLIVNEKNREKLDTFRFKYVNVWKLQPDGNYKVVIDTYNDLPKAGN